MSKSTKYTDWNAKKDEEITLYYSDPPMPATLSIAGPSQIEITVSHNAGSSKVIKNTSSRIIVSGCQIKLKPLNENAEGDFRFLGGPGFGQVWG
jgi:hypothetical protein